MGEVLQLRDYQRREERQAKADRFAVDGDMLFPTEGELFEIEASNQTWPDGDCA